MTIADVSPDLTNPSYAQGLCYQPLDMRRLHGSLVCGEGVENFDALLVTGVGTLQVAVSAGAAWVFSDFDPLDPLNVEGPYFVVSHQSQNLDIAANASGSTRIDLVVIRIADSQYTPGSSAFTLAIVQGTPGAGVPSVPSDLHTYYVLAQVTVASGDTAITGTPTWYGDTDADITDTRDSYHMCSPSGPYVTLEAAAETTIAASSTATKVSLATEVHIDSLYYTQTASIVTITESGTYDVNGMCQVTTPGLAVEVGLSHNGLHTTGTIITEHRTVRTGTPATSAVGASFSRDNVHFAAGDTVRMYALQSDGSTRDTRDTPTFKAFMTIRKTG